MISKHQKKTREIEINILINQIEINILENINQVIYHIRIRPYLSYYNILSIISHSMHIAHKRQS